MGCVWSPCLRSHTTGLLSAWTTMTWCRSPTLLQASAAMLPLAPVMDSGGTAPWRDSIMMMLQRDPGAAEATGADQLSGCKGEASHTPSLMSGESFPSIRSPEPTFIAQLGQRAGLPRAACRAARGAQQGGCPQLAAPAAQQDVRLTVHGAGRCDGILAIVGQAVHKAACLHAPELYIPILQRCTM